MRINMQLSWVGLQGLLFTQESSTGMSEFCTQMVEAQVDKYFPAASAVPTTLLPGPVDGSSATLLVTREKKGGQKRKHSPGTGTAV